MTYHEYLIEQYEEALFKLLLYELVLYQEPVNLGEKKRENNLEKSNR
ncbi:hypothetical protein [Pseudoflavonifractor capillosus]|nr:hypothetical protein [Pseudoflavonifractor capillosus]MBM6682065.1 hypothetical protein [Pseudoflavonifractor capillosus]